MAKKIKETKSKKVDKKVDKKVAQITTPKGKSKKPVSTPKKLEKEVDVKQVKFDKIRMWRLAQLDSIEKKEGLVSSLEIPYRLSTGLLSMDLALNGGFASGWYSVSGMEASAKSTFVMQLLSQAIKTSAEVLYFDAEGAVDSRYTTKICGVNTLADVFGERDNKGNWIKLPTSRYYDENGLEIVFRTMKRFLLRLPEKRYRKDTGLWYYIFDKTKDSQSAMKEMGLKPDDKLLKKTGRYWCEADNGDFQAVMILDSIPGLVTEDIGDDEDKGKQGVGLQARKFAEWVPQVRGLIRKKHVLIHVVNQLRDKPMVLFGKPTYEPGGNALKFASDVRNEMSSIATSTAPGNWGQGYNDDGTRTTQFTSEDSVEVDGTDKYAFKKLVNTKSKKGPPFKKGYARVWIEDGKGDPRGFDIVYDTYIYLKETGQLNGSSNKFKLTIKGLEHITFTWELFKALILGDTNKKVFKEYCKQLKLEKCPHLRKLCFSQIQSGKAFELIRELNISDDDDDDDEDDIDYDSEEI